MATGKRATAAPRWDGVAAFVLHSYPYKETSLIVEAFTPALGRVALVAKGAKRANSALRGLMQPFLPLQIAFSGRTEMKTLSKAEWQPGQALLTGQAVMLGYYLNELLLKLLPREDAHPALFEAYAQAINALTNGGRDPSYALRKFELRLLSEMGYGISLTDFGAQGDPIEATCGYAWLPERGLVRDSNDAPQVAGRTLLALADETQASWSAAIANDAKKFMRAVLDYHLEKRALGSRQLLRDLHALSERDG